MAALRTFCAPRNGEEADAVVLHLLPLLRLLLDAAGHREQRHRVIEDQRARAVKNGLHACRRAASELHTDARR